MDKTMKTKSQIAYRLGLSGLLALGLLAPASVFADAILARIKSRGCEVSGVECVVGAQYSKNHVAVQGVALQLLE